MSAYRFAGDPSLQTANNPLVRPPEDVRYDVALAAGAFELYGNDWWLVETEEPVREKAVLVESWGGAA